MFPYNGLCANRLSYLFVTMPNIFPARFRRIAGRILAVVAWTAMAVLLAGAAALICTVKILNPDRLTPLIERLAENNLDAELKLARAELAFKPAFPILRLQIDSLALISHAFAGQDANTALPAYSDSLLSFDRLSASVDIGAMLSRGEIALHRVELLRPAINMVIDNSGRGNFDIYNAPADTIADTSAPTAIPPFSFHRIAIEEPRAFRYFDARDSTSATIVLLREISLDGHASPEYALRVDGRLDSPVARQIVDLDNIRFGLDGRVHWSPQQPTAIALKDFSLRGAFVEATVDAALAFGTTLRVDSARLAMAPVAIDSILQLVPDSILRNMGLSRSAIATDATAAFEARLTSPFIPAADTVPQLRARLSVPESTLRIGQAHFHNLSLEAVAELHGSDYDLATVEIERFTIAGPATALSFRGEVSRLLSDPAFAGHLEGNARLSDLPPQLKAMAQGALSGKLEIDIYARGRLSMLEIGKFHGLDMHGSLTGRNLYYLQSDTSKMATVKTVTLRFGSRIHSRDTASHAPTLGMSLRLDSARALLSGVGLNVSGLTLALGVENTGIGGDTTAVRPMGGGIRIDRMSVLSITDSAGMRLRGLSGHIGLRRHKGNSHVPEILLGARIERLAAGSPLVRFMLDNANVDASTYMRPGVIARRREIKHISDSIAALYPTLPPDSVYALAIAQRRRRPHRRRTRTVIDNANNEIIDWGLTKGFRRYLNEWHLEGNIATNLARLYTPYFPIRNRMEHLQVHFNNDSVTIDNVRYKAGHSDLAIDGIISDIRRSLAGRNRNPLKVNLNICSDTMDVNQLAAAAFAGAAFAERLRAGEVSRGTFDNNDSFDREFADAVEGTDTLAPLLVPVNVDASMSLAASNIYYSDLHLTDMSGRILMFDGAVNLSNLTASSDAGNLELAALYSAPQASEIKCGLGLNLKRFNIERFLSLVPTIDSIMPLMRDFSGTINADIAATVDIDSTMNLELPTLDAAVHLSGDSLAFINAETYRTIGKWLRFRDRADNRIDHMSVQLLVRDNRMQIFPFSFDIDRYRLGVVGSNDLAMNFDYHISVLKSPLPFKFGITVKGNPDKYKIRLGGAKFKPGMAVESVGIVDTVRVNLVRQIQNVFRRGVRRSRFARLQTDKMDAAGNISLGNDTLSRADSLELVRQGMLPDVPNDSLK